MSRRFQFSLRALLGLAAVACFLLGGRHVLETYGSRIDVETVQLGAPIRAKARYFCVLGPRECVLEAGYESADGSLLPDRSYGMTGANLVKREWLCLYRTEWTLKPVDGPCQLILTFKRYDNPDLQPDRREWTIKEEIVEVKQP